MNYADIPLGLGMALTQHPGGMQAFLSLPENERMAIIEKTGSITSDEEMRQYVNKLMENRWR